MKKAGTPACLRTALMCSLLIDGNADMQSSRTAMASAMFMIAAQYISESISNTFSMQLGVKTQGFFGVTNFLQIMRRNVEECSETQASDGSHTLVMEKNPSQWGATSCGLDKVQQERMRCGVEA